MGTQEIYALNLKGALSILRSGGREGIRTPGLLIANEEKSEIRHGAAIT
jgi:hypothetical protein